MGINNPQSATAIPQLGLAQMAQNQPEAASGLASLPDPILSQSNQPGIMKNLLPFYLNYQLPLGAVPQYLAPAGPLNTHAAVLPSASATDQTPYQTYVASPPNQQAVAQGASLAGVAKSSLQLTGEIGKGIANQMGITHGLDNPLGLAGQWLSATTSFLDDPGKYLLPMAEKLAESTPLISLIAPGNVVRMAQHPTDPHSLDMWLTGGLAGGIVDTVSAWKDVFTRGSDQDWAKAIISSGQMAMYALPIKGLNRLGGSRAMLAKQFEHLNTDITPGQTFKTVTGQSGANSRLALAPLADQLAAQPQHFTDIAKQIRSASGRFAKMDDEARKWYEQGKQAEKMRESLMEAVRNLPADAPGLSKEELDYKTAALRAQADEQVKRYEMPARLFFAEHYGQKLENPADLKAFDSNHTPFSLDERAVGKDIQGQMQSEYNLLYGSLKEWGDHGGWFQGMDPTQLLEKTKTVLAGGGQRAGYLEGRQNIDNIIKASGLDPKSEGDLNTLFAALDDKVAFAALSGPQKLAARYLRNVFDHISTLNYQHSQTQLPLTHWMPKESRQRALPGVDSVSDPTRTIMDWTRGKKVGYDALFAHSMNPDGTADIHTQFPDRQTWLKSLGPDREPLSIKDTLDVTMARFFNNVTLSAMGETLLNQSVIPAQLLKSDVEAAGAKSVSEAVGNGTIPPNELPPTLPASAFRNEQEAMDLGYVKIRGSIGQPEWMNHQDAIYANDAIKTRDGTGIGTAFLHDLKNAMSREEVESAAGKMTDRVTGASKSLIMYSLVIHLTNMVGRFVNFLLANSGGTISAGLKLQLAKMNDPAMYAQMKAWYRKNGGVTAYRHDLEWEHHFQEADGSDHGPGIKRPMFGPLSTGMHNIQKNMLWKPIDDMAVVAALVAKDHFMSKGITENVADMMATRWGSDFAGQSNPLYMSQGWRKWRGRAFFAPSWWASKMRMLESVPLASAPMRLTNLLAKQVPALDPIRLKSLNDLQMREYMRLNRRQQTMSLATAVTTVNQLNQLFSGHPAWQNPSGHMLDVCFDKYAQATSPESGKSVCTSLLPGIRQDLEILDAMGMGHPWGPMHLTSDQQFAQANAWGKIYQAGSALIDGARRTGGKVVSPLAGASIEGLLGADSYTLLTKSQIKPIDRRAALLSFVPGGLQAKQAVESGGPQNIPQQLGNAALQSATGMPSIYEVGNERPQGVTQEKYDNYTVQSASLQQNRRFISQQLMSGQKDFQWWKNMNFQYLDQYTQLKADTFGSTSPSGVLSKQRDEIRKKYHLDEPMSGEMLAARQDAFETEFDHLLSNASEAVKRDYWQTERSQWTDADYLYWFSKHIDRQLQSVIDGQNGAKIRVQKAIVAQASQEGFSTAALDQMRQQMPELYLYNQLMKEMGTMSPMGALVAAARSPFSHLIFAGSDAQAAQEAALAQQGTLNPATSVISPGTEEQLVAAAKTAAESPQAIASAGTQ